jgi:hypothetical protein
VLPAACTASSTMNGMHRAADHLRSHVMLLLLCTGCLPSIATIPIFIGLYRSLMAASNEGLFEEGEHWLLLLCCHVMAPAATSKWQPLLSPPLTGSNEMSIPRQPAVCQEWSCYTRCHQQLCCYQDIKCLHGKTWVMAASKLHTALLQRPSDQGAV